ncbi:MAG: hypothetical protein WCC12_14250 [Anaerolineales bacterium]
MKKDVRLFPWYTILFAAYPALALLARNIGEVEYSVAYRAILLSIFVSAFSVFTLYLMFRDWNKAGILTVVWLGAFFFYGHVFRYIKGLEISGVVIGRHTYFMVLWALVFLAVAWFTLRGAHRNVLVPVLSTMSVVLVLFPLYQLLSYQFSVWRRVQIPPPEISVPARTAEALPDIYFIILDMYGRHDVLASEFDYDDGPFLRQLEDMGFYVASCSQSNYPSTAYSLAATLNTNYLTDLSDLFTPENTDTTLMWHLIQDSAVENILREEGYRIVAFETGYELTEWEDADNYYRLQSGKINSFEDLLLRNSFLSVFSEKDYFDQFFLGSDRRKHALSLYTLEKLEEVPDLPGPKLVFVHLTIPHPPFVVGPNGELNVVAPHYEGNESYYVKDEYKIGYQNQVAFLNARLPGVLKGILANSAQPPIIILQGDHGPRFVEWDEQLDILSAYYFPEPQPELHSFITPVNNFRIVLNAYFGTSLPMLPDRSFYTGFERPYKFVEIPNDCTAAGE